MTSWPLNNLECNLHIPHILFHCVLPNIIVILLVQSYAVSPDLGHLNTKLKVPLMIAFDHIAYDTVLLLEDVPYPPYKIRFILEFLADDILSHFKGIGLLEIHKMFPTCGPILPLNTRVLTNRGIPHLYIDSMLDVHIRTRDRLAISYVIHNAVYWVVLVALFIALCIHIMGDHIGSVLIGMPIHKFYFIGPCIHNGICIGTPTWLH
jgi:hypothetical protein